MNTVNDCIIGGRLMGNKVASAFGGGLPLRGFVLVYLLLIDEAFASSIILYQF